MVIDTFHIYGQDHFDLESAKFADEFESSWKITEQLISLPRLLVEEDTAFSLLFLVLNSGSAF